MKSFICSRTINTNTYDSDLFVTTFITTSRTINKNMYDNDLSSTTFGIDFIIELP